MFPKCAKVSVTDVATNGALAADGWRLVGVLVTYRSEARRTRTYCARYCHDRVMTVEGNDVIGLAEQIPWSGRLWRDPEIDEADARSETKRYLLTTKHRVLKLGHAAFGVFSHDRIELIGVHPLAAGLGLARTLIESAFTDETGPGLRGFEAGTYGDNKSAAALYTAMKMEPVKSENVWHK